MKWAFVAFATRQIIRFGSSGVFYLSLVALEIKLVLSLFFSTMFRFYPRSKKCEKRLPPSSCLPVRHSIRMEQFDSHWTDFNEIWYLSIFEKVEKIQVSLKLDENNSTAGEDH